MNVHQFGDAKPFKWTHDYLYKYLTESKNAVLRQPLLKDAFLQIYREDFLPIELKEKAYEDVELDIGFGEKISSPLITIKMLSLLKPKLNGKYLDIGTGSGWSTALLAVCAGGQGVVFSLERVQFIVDTARLNLAKYENLTNVKVIFSNGLEGLPEFEPYDGIHISFALKEIPKVILNQLKIGGRAIFPNKKGQIQCIQRNGTTEFQKTVYEGQLFKEGEEGIA